MRHFLTKMLCVSWGRFSFRHDSCQGIITNDLKPQNVRAKDGTAKI